MKEVLRGRLDDGTVVEVLKITEPMPDHPGLNRLPVFRLANGDTLTQRKEDTDLTLFETMRGLHVTIIR